VSDGRIRSDRPTQDETPDRPAQPHDAGSASPA
jgi:hypothetical protein